jgi:hypothetical protein
MAAPSSLKIDHSVLLENPAVLTPLGQGQMRLNRGGLQGAASAFFPPWGQARRLYIYVIAFGSLSAIFILLMSKFPSFST